MEKSTKIGFGIMVVIVIVGLFFVSSGNSGGGITGNVVGVDSGQVAGNMRHITIDAKRFEFDPGVIRVKQGEDIMLMINNADTLHGISIPALGVSGRDSVNFKATEKGEYTFYCANFCGHGHESMRGTIIIE